MFLLYSGAGCASSGRKDPSPLGAQRKPAASWRFYVRIVLTAVLVAIMLTALPAMAAPPGAPSAPLGVVVLAENAHVGVDATYSGATIYDGDRLETPDGGNLRVRFGASQMYLRQSSAAAVHSLTNGFSAELGYGTIVVTSAEGQTFQVLADGATIRPANAQPTSVQITKISGTELVLTGNRGTALVSMGDEVKTLEAGNSYRLEVQPEESGPGPQPQFPSPTAVNRFLWVLIPAIGIATGVVIWRAVMSPSGL